MLLNIIQCIDKSTKQNYLTSNGTGVRNETLYNNGAFCTMFTMLNNETINKYQGLCYIFYKELINSAQWVWVSRDCS